ncbi:MAG: 50S ribosomal protein L34, partial [Clostridia bacterium]|nr:50S ribosomal protein L34 [Clostridia bacterium]
AKVHGFLGRMASKNGRKVIAARRKKGRAKIACVSFFLIASSSCFLASSFLALALSAIFALFLTSSSA